MEKTKIKIDDINKKINKYSKELEIVGEKLDDWGFYIFKKRTLNFILYHLIVFVFISYFTNLDQLIEEVRYLAALIYYLLISLIPLFIYIVYQSLTGFTFKGSSDRSFNKMTNRKRYLIEEINKNKLRIKFDSENEELAKQIFSIKHKLESLFSGLKIEKPEEFTSLRTSNDEVFSWISNHKFCFSAKSIELLIQISMEPEKDYLDSLVAYGIDYHDLFEKTLASVGFIGFDSILYWRIMGEKTEKLEIYGGESYGGGVSIGGALLGGLVAGTAGMVLGGLKQNQIAPIRSKINVDDKRYVSLYYFDKNQKTVKIDFNLESEEALRKLMPFKEFEYLKNSNKTDNQSKREIIASSHEEKLNKLNELLSKKLITKEEYDLKRKDIIDSI